MLKKTLNDTTVKVTFEVPAAVAGRWGHLCGDFNNWSETSHPFDRLEDGRLRTAVDLAPGRRWHFRYLLEGKRWENDWAADDYAPNAFGGQDSVVDLTDVHLGQGDLVDRTPTPVDHAAGADSSPRFK
jgi:1,4-alpha-glucan branching enzyme